MKRITFLMIVLTLVATVVVPAAAAKPLKPGPAQQEHIVAARSANTDPGWTVAAVAGGFGAAALVGGTLYVLRRRTGRDASVRVQPGYGQAG